MPERMPEAMSAPKALEMMLPQYSSAIRRPISFFLYCERVSITMVILCLELPTHFDTTKSAPGKNAASTFGYSQ